MFFSETNLRLAINHIRMELSYSMDYPTDPFWRPVFEVIDQDRTRYAAALSASIESGEYTPALCEYFHADKPNLGHRPFALLEVTDRIVYQSLLSRAGLGGRIDTNLYSFVYGNRMNSTDDFYLKPYQPQWGAFNDVQLKAFQEGAVWYAEIDIKAFYQSIHIETLMRIVDAWCDERVKTELTRQLHSWSNKTGIGIPQGPAASHVLANAYLHPLDEYIEKLHRSYDFHFSRYCDDMVIMAADELTVRRVIEEVSIFLHGYNLQLNNKTILQKLESDGFFFEKMFQYVYQEEPIAGSGSVVSIFELMPDVMQAIMQGEALSKSEASALKYYLKVADPSQSPYTQNLIDYAYRIQFLTPLICQFLQPFIDDEIVFQKIWLQVSNSHFSNFSKYWYYRLLLSARNPLDNVDFAIFVQQALVSKDDIVLLILILNRGLGAGLIGINDLRGLLKAGHPTIFTSNLFQFLPGLITEGDVLPDDILNVLLDQSLDQRVALAGVIDTKSVQDYLIHSSIQKFNEVYFQTSSVSPQLPTVDYRSEFQKMAYKIFSMGQSMQSKLSKQESANAVITESYVEKSGLNKRGINLIWVQTHDDDPIKKLVLNTDYENAIEVNIEGRRKKWAKTLFSLSVYREKRVTEYAALPQYDKNVYEFVNYNPKCQLWSHSSVRPLQLIRRRSEIMELTDHVRAIGFISHSVFEERLVSQKQRKKRS